MRAQNFGAALRKAAGEGASDDSQTYYAALADALGRVLVSEGRLQAHDIEERVESRGSAARGRWADFGDGAGKVAVAAGERAQGRG